MPDVLLLYKDNQSCFELEELCQKHGFRVKSTPDTGTALEWLKLRPFSLLLADLTLPVDQQQAVANLLWNKNPMAHFVAYSLEPSVRYDRMSEVLLGAEIARGERALERVEFFLKQSLSEVEPAQKDFQILVVEDLDSPRDIICMFLEGLGYPNSVGVRSASEALTLLESDPEKFSCIVTDIRMPQIDGKKFIELVRQHHKLQHLPIIVLTAYGTTDCLVDCLKAGASGFLVKPPKKMDLTREISRALRIVRRKSSPRLASPDEAETVRELLLSRGSL